MKYSVFIAAMLFFCLPVIGQEKKDDVNKALIPYVGVMAGGCVANPFSFTAGVQKPVKTHLSISYDIHYWNTKYECYCDDLYSKGKFTSFTPSVKLTYNSGKKGGNGFIAGIGLGYMFATDRGTEQPYTYDGMTNTYTYSKDISDGNWDFTSIAPSFQIGAAFRILRFPVTASTTYYFANTADGWMAAAGGVGFTFGFRRNK